MFKIHKKIYTYFVILIITIFLSNCNILQPNIDNKIPNNDSLSKIDSINNNIKKDTNIYKSTDDSIYFDNSNYTEYSQENYSIDEVKIYDNSSLNNFNY